MTLLIPAPIRVNGGVIQLWQVPHQLQDLDPFFDSWVVRGDTAYFRFTIWQNGSPTDLTGRTFTLQVVTSLGTDTVTLSVENSEESIISGYLSAASTLLISGSYDATVVMVESGNSTTLTKFRVNIIEDLIK